MLTGWSTTQRILLMELKLVEFVCLWARNHEYRIKKGSSHSGKNVYICYGGSYRGRLKNLAKRESYFRKCECPFQVRGSISRAKYSTIHTRNLCPIQPSTYDPLTKLSKINGKRIKRNWWLKKIRGNGNSGGNDEEKMKTRRSSMKVPKIEKRAVFVVSFPFYPSFHSKYHSNDFLKSLSVLIRSLKYSKGMSSIYSTQVVTEIVASGALWRQLHLLLFERITTE
ncbi:uncharacterized protein VP01_292g5 [Puccinia sorghi]|uniref:Uncharacterized protein n=1 Tax=Puccinia sorghi TaxID=27349 RepID=A0A0L6V170_9BASI|nr:uncharacterized protein VP01_292g5 [Puccinia sorghi]